MELRFLFKRRVASVGFLLGGLVGCAAPAPIELPRPKPAPSTAPARDSVVLRPTARAAPPSVDSSTAPAVVKATAHVSSHLPNVDPKPAPEVHTFSGCGPAGIGGDPGLNRLKNRVDEGTYLPVTHAALTQLKWPIPVERRARATWLAADSESVAKVEGTPVVVEGYFAVDPRTIHEVDGVHVEGPESTNCGTHTTQRDWHIWFNAQPRKDRTRSIVAEATPRVRANHPKWDHTSIEAAAREGRRVRVSGWLLLDQEHPEQLHASGGALQTRRSLWEIHPVMRIEILNDDGVFEDLDTWAPPP